jgi:hypothetical protein
MQWCDIGCVHRPSLALPRPPPTPETTRPLAHLVYAAAKTGHQLSERLALTVAKHLTHNRGARLAAASAADLAQLSWGLARAGIWLPELQQAIDAAVVARAPELDVHAVSTILTAAQLANNTGAELLEALAARARALAPGAGAMPLVQVVHALVKLAHPSDAALQGGWRRSPEVDGWMGGWGWGVSQSARLWSARPCSSLCRVLNHVVPINQPIPGLAVALEPQLDDLDTSTLLIALNAYRIAGHPSGASLAAAALPRVTAGVRTGIWPQQLVQVARIYSGLPQQRFVAVAEAPAAGGSGSSTSGGSSSIASEADVEELLNAVNAEVVKRLEEFSPGDLRSLVLSLGRRAGPELLQAAGEAAATAIGKQ